jgi:hypothetical protein
MGKYTVLPQSGGFGTGFAQGVQTGAALYNLHRGVKEDDEKDARNAALQAAGSATPTEVASRSAAIEGLDQAYLKAIENGDLSPEQEQAFSEGRTALQARPEATSYEFGGKTQSRPFTQGQVDSGRLAAQSGVLAKYGDPLGATRLRAAGSELDTAERKRADDEQLRGVMTRGLTVGTHTGSPSALPGQSSGGDAGGASAESGIDAPGREDLDRYLKRIAPRTMGILVSQGRLAEAKQFREFVDSEQGRAYASRWAAGMRKHAIGDTEGAVKEFVGLYNDQGYADGGTVKLNPVGDGQFRADFFDRDGKPTGSQTGALDQFSGQAALMLSPENAVKFYAEQSAQGRKQDWQDQRDEARDNRRDDRAARRDEGRDERLRLQMKHELEMLERRQAKGGGGLTATQQRSNFEIDAAREMVAGLSPQEIQRRTAKATSTGRENPDFDPSLARAAGLAGRRKVGEDEWFDGRQGRGAQPKPASGTVDPDRDRAAAKLRAERQFDNYTLGHERHTRKLPNGQVVTGYPILDRGGNIVGVVP